MSARKSLAISSSALEIATTQNEAFQKEIEDSPIDEDLINADEMQSLWALLKNSDDFLKMTGYTVNQFDMLYDKVKQAISTSIRVVHPEHQLFVILATLKFYGQYKLISMITQVPITTIERILEKNLQTVAEIYYTNFVTLESYKAINDFTRIEIDGETYELHVCVDATVQKVPRPAGSYTKENPCPLFSGKHREHCIKNQVISSMSGQILSVLSDYDGSIHDVTIFKSPESLGSITDIKQRLGINGPVCIAADKGYYGGEVDRALFKLTMPYKCHRLAPRSHGDVNLSVLTPREKRFNELLGSKRVVIENVFGRMGQRFAMPTRTYKGLRHRYVAFYKLMAALVNADILYFGNPIRDNTLLADRYRRWLTRVISESNDRLERHRASVRRSYQKTRAQVMTGVGYTDSDDDHDRAAPGPNPPPSDGPN